MADDPERDVFPTKEGQFQSSSIDVNEKYASPERRFVPHLSRTDLEDQFYKFKEENFELKKATRKQEENLKRLATKMTRLLREKKSMESAHSSGPKRDLELEEMVEDLQDKVRQLERMNTHLKEKALVAKQQVILQTRRPNPYSHIPPKVNSGNNRAAGSAYMSSINLRGKHQQSIQQKPGGTPIPPYALSLLEEARIELSNLKMLVSNQRNEIEMYHQENDLLKQNMRMRDIEFDEELNILKSQLTQKQRQHVQENLDLIRLHREVKQKNSKIQAMQSQYNEMEEKMRMLKLNHDHLIKDMDELSLRFKNEQKKNIELIGEIQKAEITFSASSEFQERIKSLIKENDVLRETNDKLIKSALGIEKEKSYNQVEQIFKDKITNLETSLDYQTKAKISLEEQLIKEKGFSLSKDETCNMLKEQVAQMKSHIEELEIKLGFLKSENIEFEDLKESIRLLKLYRSGKLESPSKSKREETDSHRTEYSKSKKDASEVSGDVASPKKLQDADQELLEKAPEELQDLNSKLKESEEERHETLQELNHVREMLSAQCTQTEAMQEEVKLLKEKLEDQQKVYQAQLEEYSHLLDIRSTRIQKLEKQLNDIAFGTTTFNMPDSDSIGESHKPVKLSRGENIFEIHINKVQFSKEGLNSLSSLSSKVFLTWNFYEFELQATPAVPANRPYFNFTSQYTVQVDDYFLYYLHESSITLELHESIGVEFNTIARAQLNFSNIFTKAKGRVQGTQNLIGINNENVDFGNLEFWIQLKMPMEETFKLFQEKIKALNYIHSNKETSMVATDILKQPSDKNTFMNKLHIKILRGTNIKSSHIGTQPSTYCVYKLYDLPYQDTQIVPASNNPEYSDHHVFPLFIDYALEKYLKTETLYIYVFDDNEPDISEHIGRTSIPLHSLVMNNPVKGTFELLKDEHAGYGSIEVLIYWQYDYTPPTEMSTAIKETLQYNATDSSPSHSSSDDELTAVPVEFQADATPTPPVPKPRTRMPSQKITSTPIPEKSDASSSDEEHTYMITPNLSPVKPAHQEHSEVPKPAQRKIRSSGSANGVNLKSAEKIEEEQEDDWSDVMSNTEKRVSYEETSDQEDKHDFYDEDSDDTDIDDFSPMAQKTLTEQVPHITIKVSHLQLEPDCALLEDSLVKLLYVEYRFLDYPMEELETPFSLPKKAPPDKIEFDFEREFLLRHKDLEKWNLLAKMFSSDLPEASLIPFTVVSEPASEDKSLECEDIGYGSVDLKKILKNEEDIINEDILVYDARGSSAVIGKLNISITALETIRLLEKFAEF